MISDAPVIANCYPHPWVTGLVAGLFAVLGVVLIRYRTLVARALVSDFMLSWWHPSPDEREPTVAFYSSVLGWMLAFFGGSMIVIPTLAFAGNLACQR